MGQGERTFFTNLQLRSCWQLGCPAWFLPLFRRECLSFPIPLISRRTREDHHMCCAMPDSMLLVILIPLRAYRETKSDLISRKGQLKGHLKSITEFQANFLLTM